MRKDYRQFRTDRVSDILILNDVFSKKHPHLKQLLPVRTAEYEGTEAIIKVDKPFAEYMKWDRHYYGFTSETDLGNEIEMVFSVKKMDKGFPRWLLMFGDRLTIIKPASLKQEIQKLLEVQLERIKTPVIQLYNTKALNIFYFIYIFKTLIAMQFSSSSV